jgi:hypothetical protein
VAAGGGVAGERHVLVHQGVGLGLRHAGPELLVVVDQAQVLHGDLAGVG